jgi:lysophospholipase L1-like esterase
MFILSLFVILLLEVSAYYVYQPTRLDAILEIISPDKEKMWKGKRNYNGDFFGAIVQHNDRGFRAIKEYNNPDVLIMGASPSYGWGVPFEQTYGAIIEKELKALNISGNVINGSVIGYSSFQGKLLLKEILSKVKPRLVILSYVINDVDRYRFYRNNSLPDNEVVAMGLVENLSSYLLRKSYIVKVYRKYLSNNKSISRPGSVRVTKEQYQSNMEEMVDLVRSIDAVPVFLQIPVNLHENKNSTSFNNLIKSSKCSTHRDNSQLFYDCFEKNNYFNSINYSNNEMRKVFAMNSSKQASLYQNSLNEVSLNKNVNIINGASIFNSSKKYLFLDRKLDPIHPNSKGHNLLAKAIVKHLKNILPN